MKKASSLIKTPPVLGRPKDAAKRDGILQAASALFMNEGYSLTSMEAVAKKADVSKLTIYSHFANKDDLFREVIRRRCDKLATPDSYLVLAQKSPKDALTELGQKFVGLVFSADSVRLHRVISTESKRNPQVGEIFYAAGPKRVRIAFGELLKEWDRRGELFIPDVSKATEQFFSLLKGELLMQIVLGLAPQPKEAELKKHVKTTVAFFLAAYTSKT